LVLAVILPLILLTCFSLWHLKSLLVLEDIESSDGVWDVRSIDFEANGAVLLGDVEYVPNELLTPEQFAASKNVVVGAIPAGTDYLTSRVRILAHPGNYAINRVSPDYGARVYVNGQFLGSAGEPSVSKDTAQLGERLFYFTAQPIDGVIEIVVQTSNYAHQDSSSHVGWQIDVDDRTNRQMETFVASSAIVMGFLILLFIVHVLMFLTLPTYRANLWIALLCLIWALRVGCTGTKILLTAVPWLSWTLAFRIEYLTIPATLLLVTLTYHQLFPGVLQKAYRVSVYAVAAVSGTFYLVASTILMSQTILYLEAIALLAAVYIITRLAMKLRKPNTEQRVIVFGLGIVLVGLITDTLFYNLVSVSFRLLPGPVADYTFVAFTLFQMTALFLGTQREVAVAKEAERRLATENAELDRMRRFERDLMTDLAHEIRTPLAVMSSYAQLAAKDLRRLEADPQTTDDLSILQDEAERLASLTSGLLELYRGHGDASRRASLELGGLLNQAGRLFAPMMKRNNNELRLDVAADLPPVHASADEITQVVLNLLSNANAHTHGGEVALTARLEQGSITVTIDDTGQGIEPELLPRVFERGVTDGGGAGIGLDICQKVIVSHGGNISIENRPTGGTTARFDLPVAEQSANA